MVPVETPGPRPAEVGETVAPVVGSVEQTPDVGRGRLRVVDEVTVGPVPAGRQLEVAGREESPGSPRADDPRPRLEDTVDPSAPTGHDVSQVRLGHAVEVASDVAPRDERRHRVRPVGLLPVEPRRVTDPEQVAVEVARRGTHLPRPWVATVPHAPVASWEDTGEEERPEEDVGRPPVRSVHDGTDISPVLLVVLGSPSSVLPLQVEVPRLGLLGKVLESAPVGIVMVPVPGVGVLKVSTV